MKTKHFYLPFLLLMIAFSIQGVTCSRETISRELPSAVMVSSNTLPAALQRELDLRSFLQTLDELAELERAGSWIQGMAFTESGIRENAGDYAGAVIAAYKELSWAYGMGLIQKQEIEQGLLNIIAAKNEDETLAVTTALLAFLNGRWDDAAAGLAPFIDIDDEPDGFGRWLLLVCVLEKDKDDRHTGAAYRSIRARYAQFPEYWYRGARAFSGIIAAEFAENGINSSPVGPFADECRKILASFIGLNVEDAPSIRTKREIEAVVSLSVNSGNPQILDVLLPLISLPDNAYTVYAVGALRALASISGFRDYYARRAEASSGRLAERLSFLGRG
ncbi:MAG: hypothetical protein LBC80_04300 [Treponema sp.]|nr:hypothetical protein [Treponema sp.]